MVVFFFSGPVTDRILTGSKVIPNLRSLTRGCQYQGISKYLKKKKKKPWQNKFKKTMKHIFMKGVVRCHKSKKWQYLKYPRKLRKQGKPPHPAYFCLLFHYPPTVILRFSDIYKVMILVCVGTVKVSMTDSCKEPNSLAK